MACRPSTTFEISIPGDELEQHRIQLERQIQNTDISLHLSSSQGEDDSVEYPRHHSNHSLGFASFEQPSQHFDYDAPSGLHAWSMHEDEGINPYAGETASTIGHHASAVTIGAGLSGRGQRREVSLSGAEYDPERPLPDMIAGLDSYISIQDPSPTSRSRHTPSSRAVDLSGDYDISQIAHPAALAARFRSPPLEVVESEGERSHNISRRKLSDTLQHVGFSPRRPRNLQTRLTAQPSPSRTHSHQYEVQDPQHNLSHTRKATPKARKASHSVSFDVDVMPMRRHVSQPQVVVQPPTPSASSSKFTRMARGITKEVREAQAEDAELFQNQSHTTTTPRAVPSGSRRVSSKHHEPKQLVHDVSEHDVVDANVDISQTSRSFRKANRGRVNLPDLTGLTSAVVSPAKASLERYGIKAAGSSKEVEARLIASLNALHAKLAHLETENGVARRRVRELEYELQQCKRDVARERTRMMEQSAGPSGKKTEEPHQEIEVDQSKYFEVVEEKKALESLISTLRSHLARVTADLTVQQQLLEELKRFREEDTRMLAAKTDEIGALRVEVERLAGEIEVLRNVVEEGLIERRMAREQSQLEPVKEESEVSVQDPSHRELEPSYQETDTPRTMPRPGFQSARRFVDVDELTRISEDLEERRSERSSVGSPSLSSQRSLRSHPGDVTRSQLSDSEDETPRATGTKGSKNVEIVPSDNLEEQRSEKSYRGSPSRRGSRPANVTHTALADTEGGKRRANKKETAGADVAPFPRIRSARLENLFFSAPKHNAGTCARCNGHPVRTGNHQSTRPRATRNRGCDPPVGEQCHDRQARDDPSDHETKSFEGDEVDSYEAIFQGDRLPSQTVLARVLRELEEEFIHHKGVYSELAEEFRGMDAMVQAARRRIVAGHLRDIIDLIERKGDQIQSLYDLLKVEDNPLTRQRTS